jgi:hypothetical protein
LPSHPLKIHFYLSDHTLEIREIPGRQGYFQFPVMLKRSRLAKNWEEVWRWCGVLGCAEHADLPLVRSSVARSPSTLRAKT